MLRKSSFFAKRDREKRIPSKAPAQPVLACLLPNNHNKTRSVQKNYIAGRLFMKFFNSNIKHYTFPFATAFCIALSGCGGDDSGTAATSSSGDTLTAVVITESNMMDVAGGVIMSTSANSLGASGPALVMGVETTSIPAPTDTLVKLAVEQAKAANSKLSAQEIVAGVESIESYPCSVSGSETYSYDLQSTSSTFVAGDSVSVSFSACDNGDGTLLNGGMQLTINSFTGFTDSPVGSMNLSLSFSNLSITTAQAGITTNGGMNIAATITDTVASITVQASSISYALENNGQRMSMTLANLNTEMDEYADRIEMTVSERFSASFPAFSGSVDVTTVSPFVEDWASGTASGEFKVAGDNSILYITFLGGDSVYLKLDRDNNGTIDASATKTLSELDPTIGLI
jgi:hypothetical protein